MIQDLRFAPVDLAEVRGYRVSIHKFESPPLCDLCSLKPRRGNGSNGTFVRRSLCSFFNRPGPQGGASERVLFHAKIFTADPQNRCAEAVAIRGDMVLAVGALPEFLKSVSENAEPIDLEGKSLFPGFIDSHSHCRDGGLVLIGADPADKVDTLDQLAAFVAQAKLARRCQPQFSDRRGNPVRNPKMRGRIVRSKV